MPATIRLSRGHSARAAVAEAPRVIVERRAVLNALYQQGLRALRRGDCAAAADALAAVADEAPDAYPDAHARLVEARRGATEHAPRAAEPRRALANSLLAAITRATSSGHWRWWALAALVVGLLLGGMSLLSGPAPASPSPAIAEGA